MLLILLQMLGGTKADTPTQHPEPTKRWAPSGENEMAVIGRRAAVPSLMTIPGIRTGKKSTSICEKPTPNTNKQLGRKTDD